MGPFFRSTGVLGKYFPIRGRKEDRRSPGNSKANRSTRSSNSMDKGQWMRGQEMRGQGMAEQPESGRNLLEATWAECVIPYHARVQNVPVILRFRDMVNPGLRSGAIRCAQSPFA